MVKFKGESLLLDSWSKKGQYNAFCDILGSGINHHLAQNKVLRKTFDLGEVAGQTSDQQPKRSKDVSKGSPASKSCILSHTDRTVVINYSISVLG